MIQSVLIKLILMYEGRKHTEELCRTESLNDLLYNDGDEFL